MSSKTLLKGIFIAFIIIFSLNIGCGSKAELPELAPDFTLQDLTGNNVSLKDFRGKPVLVDFWATWCPPCRVSIPELVDLQNKYKDKGLIILGISVDEKQEADNQFLTAFKHEFKINYRILRADQKVIRDYFENRQVAVPTMFVLNKEGRIVDVHVGFRPGAVESSLKKIIK